MKCLTRLFTCLLGTTTLVIALSRAIATALTPEEIDAIASQTTVVIAEGLQKGDIENRRDLFDPGSGVIIARQDNIYYVLTAFHVISTEGVKYGIRTWDGEVYFSKDELNHNEKEPNILRLGDQQGRIINGFDLAIIKFKSNKKYYTAPVNIASLEQLMPEDALFVSGWPNPENRSAYRVRKFTNGFLSKVNPNPDPNGGYSLLYSNETSTGMSGGPVFNKDGWLIGIHGRGKAEQIAYCVDPQLSRNNNCGIQMVHFLTTAEAEYLNNLTNLNQESVEPSVIADGLENKERADVIENIYEDFTLNFVESAIKNYPSGACWSLLLGEDFCND